MDSETLEQQSQIPGQVFATALCETIATMAGITLEQVWESWEPGCEFDCRHICGAMILTGERTAVLLVAAAQDSVTELVAYMTGIDSAELTARELDDGVLEIVNMVAGMAKARLAGSTEAFRLSTPFAVVGSGIVLITKRNVASFGARFSAGNVQLTLKFFYV